MYQGNAIRITVKLTRANILMGTEVSQYAHMHALVCR